MELPTTVCVAPSMEGYPPAQRPCWQLWLYSGTLLLEGWMVEWLAEREGKGLSSRVWYDCWC